MLLTIEEIGYMMFSKKTVFKVQVLCESLRDVSVLTQRSSLDVLVLCCPLRDIPISKSDVCDLLYAALHCMLRRDMSLNRRLYSWLLGTCRETVNLHDVRIGFGFVRR